MAAPLYSTESGRLYHAGQILISVVGLPARGKTHLSRSLERYLAWLGVRTQTFSLSDHRRDIVGPKDALPDDYFTLDPSKRSKDSEELRIKIKDSMLEKIGQWFTEENGQVAIYDANNITLEARNELRDFFKTLDVHCFFIESVCDNPDVVERNIRAVKLTSPDYAGWDPDRAVKDYYARIKEHEKVYQTIEQPSFPYVKLINVGERIIVNNIQGYLQSRIVFFLMNVHNRHRTIWLARSGQAVVEHSYKADATLSDEGVHYAQQLKQFIVTKRRDIAISRHQKGEHVRERPLVVWTSSRRRCLETAKPFWESGFRVSQFSQMSEINPGVIDGMTVEEIKEAYPEEYERSIKEPFSHRYPRAESYHDLSVRLEPVIFNLERDRHDILVVAHASVLRCLFSYLKGLSPAELPKVDVQRGDVIEIEPTSYGIVSRTHHFYDDPHIKRLPKSDAYIYGSPARAPDFPKGEPSSWNKRHPQPDPELEESDFPVGKAPHES